MSSRAQRRILDGPTESPRSGPRRSFACRLRMTKCLSAQDDPRPRRPRPLHLPAARARARNDKLLHRVSRRRNSARSTPELDLPFGAAARIEVTAYRGRRNSS